MTHRNCHSADATLAEIAWRGSSVSRLWNNIDFQPIDKILIPMNPSKCHWILLVR